MFYNFWRNLIVGLAYLLFGVRVRGRERLPRSGAYVVAPSHRSTLDIPFWLFAAPMLVGFALAALGYIWFALRRQDPPLGGGTQI